ncbi:hypothetical protein HDU85_003297 [Gaertneriomyces sp. JEL0708]|nr:hypothetical protein HDU85_003297 [Gaertneriomyces sp. JEL0708]
MGKARKHTGAPLSNLVGDQGDHEESLGVGIALLLVDVINDIDFEGNDYMVAEAKKMAPKIRDLTSRCRELNVPVIYCNDNFGKWRSNLEQIYEKVTSSDDVPGKPVVEMLKPQKDDYFVMKPKHSAFYATALDSLLTYLQVKSLIMVGMAGNVCILFTANDAYMRDFATFVPRDCIASSSPEEHSAALLLMERVLRTSTLSSDELDLCELVEAHKQRGLVFINNHLVSGHFGDSLVTLQGLHLSAELRGEWRPTTIRLQRRRKRASTYQCGQGSSNMTNIDYAPLSPLLDQFVERELGPRTRAAKEQAASIRHTIKAVASETLGCTTDVDLRGSLAKGTNGPRSDLDMVVKAPVEVTRSLRTAFAAGLKKKYELSPMQISTK